MNSVRKWFIADRVSAVLLILLLSSFGLAIGAFAVLGSIQTLAFPYAIPVFGLLAGTILCHVFIEIIITKYRPQSNTHGKYRRVQYATVFVFLVLVVRLVIM
jgi:hypothetical protein